MLSEYNSVNFFNQQFKYLALWFSEEGETNLNYTFLYHILIMCFFGVLSVFLSQCLFKLAHKVKHKYWEQKYMKHRTTKNYSFMVSDDYFIEAYM